MGLSQRLRDLLTLPTVETTAYECTNCGVITDTDEDVCPDCGGEVMAVSSAPPPEYWGPMM